MRKQAYRCLLRAGQLGQRCGFRFRGLEATDARARSRRGGRRAGEQRQGDSPWQGYVGPGLSA